MPWRAYRGITEEVAMKQTFYKGKLKKFATHEVYLRVVYLLNLCVTATNTHATGMHVCNGCACITWVTEHVKM